MLSSFFILSFFFMPSFLVLGFFLLAFLSFIWSFFISSCFMLSSCFIWSCCDWSCFILSPDWAVAANGTARKHVNISLHSVFFTIRLLFWIGNSPDTLARRTVG